jgi:hypothetical protein
MGIECLGPGYALDKRLECVYTLHRQDKVCTDLYSQWQRCWTIDQVVRFYCNFCFFS